MSSNDESEELGKLTRKKSLKNVAPPTYIPQSALSTSLCVCIYLCIYAYSLRFLHIKT